MWNGAFGNRSFKRRFGSYKAVQALCTDIFTHTLEGTCGCITVRDEVLGPGLEPLLDVWFEKVTICRVPLPPLPEWLDEDDPWITVRLVREHQEHDVGAINNSCNAMETVMYNKFG
jgi:hypothetical protein